jgi:hypothetical protein
MSHQANVVLHVGELAYGDRPWEVTSRDNPLDIQLRTEHELFHKENLQNIIISRFPSDWQYGMACDADFNIVQPTDWALGVIHKLQYYDWIQPFSWYVDLDPNNLPLRQNTGFFFNYIENGFEISPQYHNGFIGADGKFVSGPSNEYEVAMVKPSSPAVTGRFMRGTGATGGAFAFTRYAFDTVGGMLDRCILGHADWYMAHQLVGIIPHTNFSGKYHSDYIKYIQGWGERAAALKKNVGYVEAFAVHGFHGSKMKRAYGSRDSILAEEQYNPLYDVKPDWQGILQLDDSRPHYMALRDKIRKYFLSRNEDDPSLYGNEKIIV